MKITKELLRRHLLGLCTEEEKRAVEDWLEMEENSSTGFYLIKGDERKKQQIWSQLSRDFPELNEETTAKTPGVIPFSKRFIQYATAAIVLFTAGFFCYRTLSDSFGTGESEQSIALKTINTQRGEKRTIKLPDGSTIKLNYETEVKVPGRFEGGERVVYLTGHAYFDVQKDPGRPFTIYTNDSKTQVLGTSFDINTNEEGTEVIVTSGKVAFSEKDDANNQVTLTVNDRAVLNFNKKITTSKVDALRITAWKDNRLIFEKASLEEIIKVLEPWYDINIQVTRAELLEVKYRFSKSNPSLEEVLSQLSVLGNFEYKVEEKNVIIS